MSLELAFYIDKKGKRVQEDWCISWEGHPTAFCFKFPYVVAFTTNFIEVRHIDSVSFCGFFFLKKKSNSCLGRFVSSYTGKQYPLPSSGFHRRYSWCDG